MCVHVEEVACKILQSLGVEDLGCYYSNQEVTTAAHPEQLLWLAAVGNVLTQACHKK